MHTAVPSQAALHCRVASGCAPFVYLADPCSGLSRLAHFPDGGCFDRGLFHWDRKVFSVGASHHGVADPQLLAVETQKLDWGLCLLRPFDWGLIRLGPDSIRTGR